MNQLIAEITSRFSGPSDCASLLYEATPGILCQRSKVYEITFAEDASLANQFIRRVLVDEIANDLSTSGIPRLTDWTFYLEYGMKPGVLDLEQRAILEYLKRQNDEESATILGLKILHRIYVFGRGASPEKFAHDVCNPAIHHWRVHPSAN